MTKWIFIAALIATTACSTKQKTKFQERDEPTGLGYQAEKSPVPDTYEVNLYLDADTEVNYAKNYAHRAAGEVCLKNGFKYFDATNTLLVSVLDEVRTEKMAVFCYPTKTRVGLNIVFVGDTSVPNQDLKVEELPVGVKTPIQVNDLITAVNRQKVFSVYELKKLIRQAADKKAKTVELTYVHEGKEATTKFPMITSESNLGPEDLETFRTYSN